jgi:hypothetical protein
VNVRGEAHLQRDAAIKHILRQRPQSHHLALLVELNLRCLVLSRCVMNTVQHVALHDKQIMLHFFLAHAEAFYSLERL